MWEGKIAPVINKIKSSKRSPFATGPPTSGQFVCSGRRLVAFMSCSERLTTLWIRLLDSHLSISVSDSLLPALLTGCYDLLFFAVPCFTFTDSAWLVAACSLFSGHNKMTSLLIIRGEVKSSPLIVKGIGNLSFIVLPSLVKKKFLVVLESFFLCSRNDQ